MPALSASLPSTDAFCGIAPKRYTCLSAVVLGKSDWLGFWTRRKCQSKSLFPRQGSLDVQQPIAIFNCLITDQPARERSGASLTSSDWTRLSPRGERHDDEVYATQANEERSAAQSNPESKPPFCPAKRDHLCRGRSSGARRRRDLQPTVCAPVTIWRARRFDTMPSQPSEQACWADDRARRASMGRRNGIFGARLGACKQ